MGKHRQVIYKIGYGRFVLYGQIWYSGGSWFVNTVDRGTVKVF